MRIGKKALGLFELAGLLAEPCSTPQPVDVITDQYYLEQTSRLLKKISKDTSDLYYNELVNSFNNQAQTISIYLQGLVEHDQRLRDREQATALER